MTTITRLDHPTSIHASGMFVLRAEEDIWSGVLLDKVGDLDLAESARFTYMLGALPQYHRHIRLVASDVDVPSRESDVIGIAVVDLRMGSTTPRVADVSVAVRPERLGQGIGSALHAAALDVAAEHQRTTIQAWTWEPATIPDGARQLPARTGSGGVEADSRETRFLLRQGYALGQFARNSRLHLPPSDELARRRDELLADKPAGYEIITIQGRTPLRFLADAAKLSAIMATDSPSGSMDVEDESWDPERVRLSDDVLEEAQRDQLQTLVRHAPSGELVGFTRLLRDRDRPEVVHQWETLVVSTHRGHGLGMLMKVVNHAAVAELWPGAQRLVTGNASENGHMLDINIALGYEPHAANGFWELRRGADG
ncbi:MAG: GNAT family N-acetyltransferase [Propionibacteriaceae bacterium]|nr:GNAT family N-acetyltransferase [Propionibacteriaceae bacterium]